MQKWNPSFSTAPVIGSAINTAALTKTKTTEYIGNIIYENSVLKRILIDGGYIEGGVYYYYLNDHQGNNRVVINASGTAIQRNHYYPVGTAFAENTVAEQGKQPYKYNGKELDQMHGLNLYDYSARFKDDFRFITVDPLAEKYYSWSPYAYCNNNPLKFVDPDGKQIWPVGPLLGTNNPVMSAMGRNAIMMSNADKVVRILPKEKHHYIPNALKGNEVVKAAREGGFKFDGKENKIPLDKFNRTTGEGQHGNHPKYTEQIENKLDAFSEKNPNFTPEQAVEAVRQIISNIKNDMESNPGTKINDLKLNQMVAPSDNTKVSKPAIVSPAQEKEIQENARRQHRLNEMIKAGFAT